MMDGCTICQGARLHALHGSATTSTVTKREPHEFFESFSALSRCVRALAAEAYAAIEVGSAQAKLLRYIGRHSGISQADLARATWTAPTLTGRAIEPLVTRGWVRRKRSEEDRRQYILELTAAGQRTRQRVDEARATVIKRMEAVLDAKDIEDFERIANKIVAAFDGAGEG
jgi:DNA-binding MarR family transcriptional regulator